MLFAIVISDTQSFLSIVCHTIIMKRGLFMTFENLITAISSVGFPIVVSLYMITTVNKTLDTLKDSIDKLTYIVQEKMVRETDSFVEFCDRVGKHKNENK